MRKLFVLCVLSMACLGAAETWTNCLSGLSVIDIEKYGEDIWAATASEGAYRYSAEDDRWYRYNKATGAMSKTDDIYDMEIIDGRVWCATSGGIYSCNTDGSGWKNELPSSDIMDNWVMDICHNSSHVFLATFGGLVVYSKSSKTYTSVDITMNGYYKSAQTRSVEADESTLWVGTEDGVVKIDLAQGVENAAARTYIGGTSDFPAEGNYATVISIFDDGASQWYGLEEYGTEGYCTGGLYVNTGGHWRVFDENSGLPGDGIHFLQPAGDELYAGLFSYVDGVNFNGKGLLKLDLTDSSWTVLDSSNWHIGVNSVRSFYCDAEDTLVGTDEGIFSSRADLPGLRPFEKPAAFSVQSLGNGQCRVLTNSVEYADRYICSYKPCGDSEYEEMVLQDTCDTLGGLTLETDYIFSLCAANAYGSGPECDLPVVCRLTESVNDILLVNGFGSDIALGDPEFMMLHGSAIAACGEGYDGCSDVMIEEDLLDARDYEIVDWFCGIDAAAMSEICREKIKNYLVSGGKLFINGAQFVEKLAGATNDTAFYNGYLKSVWKKSDTRCYEAAGMEQGVFRGVGQFSFDDGTQMAYDVARPDGFLPVSGAEAALLYAEKDSSDYGCAAVSYSGTFGVSSVPGQLLYMGIPLESVYPDSMRHALMACVLKYFGRDVILTDVSLPDAVENFHLFKNYPNPFNPVTKIDFKLSTASAVTVSIYDCSGRFVCTLTDGRFTAGYHSLTWDASGNAAGIYVARIQTSADTKHLKMIFLK